VPAIWLTNLHRLRSDRKIRNFSYYKIREQYGLTSDLTCQVCRRVGGNRKSAQSSDLSFSPTSIDYNAKTFSLRTGQQLVSLATTSGRKKVALELGGYQREMLRGQSPTSAQLCLRKDGSFSLNIQIELETPEPECSGNFLGIDLGRRDIATTSDGQSWKGRAIQQKRDKFSRVRASIQRKASEGTRSTRRRARRLLQWLRGKERRYQQWLNHNISKAIVRQAKNTDRGIALEELTGIRSSINSKPRSQQERRKTNNWAFYQLRTFIEYKASLAGVSVKGVPPAYTSQTCHSCNRIGNRSEKRFRCTHCHWQGDADVNAAQTIANYGAAVNRPGGPGLITCKPKKITTSCNGPLV